MNPARALRIGAWTEALTLTLLLANLLTVHAEVVTTLGGPLHGCAYLITFAASWLVPSATSRDRWLAAVPGVGGLLTLRRLS